MSTPQGDFEVYSAILDDATITEVCRVLNVRGVCSACGLGVLRELHAPMVTHGWFHAECCPCCTGAVIVSEAERQAMITNRWRPLSTSTEEKQAVLASVQSHSEPVKPLRLRARNRIAAAIRHDEQKWRMQRTLHLTATFEGAGLIPNLIRDSHGRLIADIITEARRVPIAGKLVMDAINQGVEAGMLRLS